MYKSASKVKIGKIKKNHLGNGECPAVSTICLLLDRDWECMCTIDGGCWERGSSPLIASNPNF